LKRALHWIGVLLCIAAVAFFAHEIRQSGLQLPPGGVMHAAGWLLLASIAYSACVALLALLWSSLVLGVHPPGDVRAEVISSYLVSQFGKYIPGNVFQYVGRHALGRKLGTPHATLASAAAVEIGFLLATAAIVAAIFSGAFIGDMAWLRPTAAAAGGAALLALYVAPRLIPAFPAVLRFDLARGLLLAMGYVAFFVGFGLLYWVCLWLFGAPVSLHDPIGSAALGWVLGFIVPGAPAGAGLREAALALTFDGRQATSMVTSAIVAFRVVTMLGDFIAFLAGLAMRRLRRKEPTSALPLSDN